MAGAGLPSLANGLALSGCAAPCLGEVSCWGVAGYTPVLHTLIAPKTMNDQKRNGGKKTETGESGIKIG